MHCATLMPMCALQLASLNMFQDNVTYVDPHAFLALAAALAYSSRVFIPMAWKEVCGVFSCH